MTFSGILQKKKLIEFIFFKDMKVLDFVLRFENNLIVAQ